MDNEAIEGTYLFVRNLQELKKYKNWFVRIEKKDKRSVSGTLKYEKGDKGIEHPRVSYHGMVSPVEKGDMIHFLKKLS